MRYIKYFESITELEGLSKDYLANLLDIGIKIRVSQNLVEKRGDYSLILSGNFRIQDIKDDLYQFINIIKHNDYLPNGIPTIGYKDGYSITSKRISLGELLSGKFYSEVYRINIPLRKFKIKIK